MSRPFFVLPTLLLLFASVVACGSANDAESPPFVEIEARYATDIAANVGTLSAASDAVFIGTVEERTGQRDVRLSDNNHRTFPVTSYAVRVVDVMQGDLAAGDGVTVDQTGGLTDSADGPVNVGFARDERIEVGGTYVFFAFRGDAGAFVTPPFARMRVVDGEVQAPAGWEQLGAVAQLAGLTQTEAAREVSSE
jgi:hypothetical protein